MRYAWKPAAECRPPKVSVLIQPTTPASCNTIATTIVETRVPRIANARHNVRDKEAALGACIQAQN